MSTEQKKSLLKVLTGLSSSTRTNAAAIRTFRETGASEQPSLTPTLQALLDYCFQRKRDFTLKWNSTTGNWTLTQEKGHAVATPLWTPEGEAPPGEPPKVLLSKIGAFTAILSKANVGWRLTVVGTPVTLEINEESVEVAMARANGQLRETFWQAAALVDRVHPK